jgi:hypothetical protein
MGAVLLGAIGVASAGQPVRLTDAELEKVTVYLGSPPPPETPTDWIIEEEGERL